MSNFLPLKVKYRIWTIAEAKMLSDFLPPNVPPRREFLAKFVSFGIFDRKGRSKMSFRWQRDRKLERRFKNIVQQNPDLKQMLEERDDRSLLENLLQLWQSASSDRQKSLFGNCIFAYLEEPRYRAALTRFHAFRDFENPEQSWDYYLAIAGDVTLNPEKVLALLPRYNPAKSKLETFWDFELQSIMKEISNKETTEGKYSLWYKLKVASKKKLKEGLVEVVGVSEREAISYIFARDALFQVYSKKDNRWREPTRKKYQEAADYLKCHYADKCPNSDRVNEEWLQQAIEICAQALQPSHKLCYLDEGYNSQELEMLNSSGDGRAENPLDNLANQEFEANIRDKIPAINEAIVSKLEEFSAEQKEILQLRYGLDTSGSKIAKKIGKNKSTVSRIDYKCRRELMGAIFFWANKEEMGIGIKDIKGLDDVLEDWLKNYYKNL
ncbi:MAG: sigma-70 family RNA polymerase sigma factor [Oscillatoria sp. SIO1A7]|nr:sigma-70 family RNA polymerase sigma factor [Oscillatoria sp. SIO1A7]